MEHKVVTDYTSGVTLENSTVKVFVRARPPDKAEVPKGMFEIKGDKKKISIRDPNTRNKYGEHAFLFDKAFWIDDSQEVLQKGVCEDLIQHTLKGFNSCCFAYGQTGSGKTHTMFGGDGEMRGLIPRSVERIFDLLSSKGPRIESTVVVSFLEIYCDKIRDLGKVYLETDDDSRKRMVRQKTDAWFSKQDRSGIMSQYSDENLSIHEDVDGNVFVRDLSIVPVTTPEEVLTMVQLGFKLRATHETRMNSVSSRSHTVFSMRIIQTDTSTGDEVQGVLNLVDLAGSERLHKSASEGQRLQEALHINTSLYALAKVVMALDPSKDISHVPYRDSKLTRVLQNSIGGNSYTSVIATVHPRAMDYEECLSTLQFANRCRNVQNQPRVNHTAGPQADKEMKFQKLVTQVQALRSVVAKVRSLSDRRLMEVVQHFGGKGQITADGRLQLEDGAIIGESDDSLENTGSDRMINSNLRKGVRFGDNAAVVSTLKQKLDQAQSRTQSLQQKLESSRSEIESLRKQDLQRSGRMNTTLSKQRHTVKELRNMVNKKSEQLQAELALTEKEHNMNLKEVLEHNNRLMEEQAHFLQSLPATMAKTQLRPLMLTMNSQNMHSTFSTINSQSSSGDNVNKCCDCASTNKEKVNKLVSRHEKEVETLRQQHNFWQEQRKQDMNILRQQLQDVQRQYQLISKNYDAEVNACSTAFHHQASTLKLAMKINPQHFDGLPDCPIEVDPSFAHSRRISAINRYSTKLQQFCNSVQRRLRDSHRKTKNRTTHAPLPASSLSRTMTSHVGSVTSRPRSNSSKRIIPRGFNNQNGSFSQRSLGVREPMTLNNRPKNNTVTRSPMRGIMSSSSSTIRMKTSSSASVFNNNNNSNTINRTNSHPINLPMDSRPLTTTAAWSAAAAEYKM
eukprot:TRINITY_DN73399_c0_g1_i1.p1 TRINITY_DN73399_c0_g1~~TRINITY_DN73399_c0_g1_i1.p1  ORF type:complete len:903 (-),score=213.29 TRINITY_DN73399_c0_g1_i1:270-2978(-)